MSKWLDQHTGQTWKYAMVYRPAQVGFTCPRDGYLLRLDTDAAAKHAEYPHGLIYYSRQLTTEEIATYQLKAL